IGSAPAEPRACHAAKVADGLNQFAMIGPRVPVDPSGRGWRIYRLAIPNWHKADRAERRPAQRTTRSWAGQNRARPTPAGAASTFCTRIRIQALLELLT